MVVEERLPLAPDIDVRSFDVVEELSTVVSESLVDLISGIAPTSRRRLADEIPRIVAMLDIYATSVDYQPDTDLSQQFFATVQNKMHWAAAAEVVHGRADGGKLFMGMQTTRPGGVVRKADAAIAKNYLTKPELQVLHRIVNLYIEFAELQALERNPMTMCDWIDKLDEFLKASGRKLLDHAGTISAEVAKAKAEHEYERYQALQDAKQRTIDAAFEETAKQLKRPGPTRAKKGRGKS